MVARFSAPVQTGPGAQPASCTMGTGSFPGVKRRRDVTLIPHRLLVPWSRKGRAIPLLPLWAVRPVHSLSACARVYFTLSTFRPYYGPEYDLDYNRNEYQGYLLGRKDGRCVGLKTLALSCANCLQIWETQTTGTLYRPLEELIFMHIMMSCCVY